MPEMNGYEATHAIREAESECDRQTPIIAVTAHAMKDDADQRLAAGMDDYVSKPLSTATQKDPLDHWVHVAAEAAA